MQEVHKKMERMDTMSEPQLKQLLKDYKQSSIPQYRRNMVYLYTVASCGILMYYTVNCKQINQKYFKPKKFTMWSMVKIGTMQAIGFSAVFSLGLILVSGIYHPVKYLKEYSNIQGKINSMVLRFDTNLQKSVLFDTMKSFGLSDALIRQAEQQIQQSKHRMIENNQFTEQTLKIIKGEEKSTSVLNSLLSPSTKIV